jgi:phosphoglycolate phosphatase-like HAD superfamily hydrolase
MLCTKCSREVKPVVAIDIDGTLGDYHGHFLLFAENYLGSDKRFGVDHVRVWEDYAGDEPFRVWFARSYDVDFTTFREIKLAYRAGGMKRTMPKYADASSLMSSLQRMNFEVWITTTRPYLRLDGIDRDTREWLRRNNIFYDHLLYDEEKYSVLAENVGVDRVVAVLDDEVEQLRKAERLWGPQAPILRRQQYNRGVQWDRATSHSLTGATQLIANRVQDWRISHAKPAQQGTN